MQTRDAIVRTLTPNNESPKLYPRGLNSTNKAIEMEDLPRRKSHRLHTFMQEKCKTTNTKAIRHCQAKHCKLHLTLFRLAETDYCRRLRWRLPSYEDERQFVNEEIGHTSVRLLFSPVRAASLQCQIVHDAAISAKNNNIRIDTALHYINVNIFIALHLIVNYFLDPSKIHSQ